MNDRRAKIVATLGPASDSKEVITRLIHSGLNVARINMSHGTHEGHKKVIDTIREVSLHIGKEVGILLDLQGPKIRVDKLPENLILSSGEKWAIGTKDALVKYPDFKDNAIPTVYKDLVKDSEVGVRVLFDDGLIIAKAIDKKEDILIIEVSVGGELKSNKGINLPDTNVSCPSLTPKDEEDLVFGLRADVDFVALSFVRKAEDIQKVKNIIHKRKLNIPIIAKVENPEAIENIDEIIEASDIVMVARGDLGVELGNHLVPSLQKMIIRKCNETGTPVITATQMLESMIHNPTPTRAEASDVANAIWDGTDAVMLSGETAAGKYPELTIQMMAQVVIEAEKTPKSRPYLRNVELSSTTSTLQVAASLIAEKVNAKWIICVTQGGNSSLKISRFRPQNKVIGLTNSLKVARKMSLYWGVRPMIIDVGEAEDISVVEKDNIDMFIRKLGLVKGDKIVITHGDGKYFKDGFSNSVRVETVRRNPKSTKKSTDSLLVGESDKVSILLETDICASCQNCIQVCPHGIYTYSKDDQKRTIIDQSRVIHCDMDGQCVEVCPTGALELIPNLK
jgi:pyruvate kinase